ncbi:cation:proton antiporter [Pisciglobus halotolerans]|uniref:NhaP-type Na+/H+ or K+/H+ antiporter n=1 Tax=Pisciglobus halotolerans TaxID=745365 RepID=A0A1I3B9T3_9LACT|nr:sodium:proton antiporter [Pisciglobus halotolerans]SFH58461.1 NhaP-type Na+/H+ or K+/H+ antiporter [Pisciglobus halotolerans]
MEEAALLSIVIIVVLGIFSQWIAWRIQWPSIVIMSIAGLLIGPVFGIVQPEQSFGEMYSPMISLAVAVILFEGSSSLDIREVKGISKSIFRIVTWGAFLGWIGGALAAHFVAGLSLEISFIIGGLFIVTGPTVIIPLLRQSKLQPRTATILKWEGIIVDPAGPLVALFAYEVIRVTTNSAVHPGYLVTFFISSILSGIVGYLLGLLLSMLTSRGRFPEYLKSPIILSFLFICFSLGEVIMNETGMLSVTVMGLTIGHAKKSVSSIKSIGHFVEDISVLLTSTVFILLTASLPKEVISQVFTWPIMAFVLVMLFIVRPLSIWISTIGTEVTTQEKILISWIAPRGIVALTVSGYFAEILIADGYEDATLLTALTFALVFITVCAHGFTLGPLAKKLGLASTERPGILIVGANTFSIAFAEYCQSIGIPVLIVDHSYTHYQRAKDKGIPAYYGEILSEHTQFNIDLTPYETMLIMTDEAAYSALVFQSYVQEFGYNHTFILAVQIKHDFQKQTFPSSMKSNILFGELSEELNQKLKDGKTFSLVDLNITERKMMESENLPIDGTLLFILKKNGSLSFVTVNHRIVLDKGDQAVVLSS